MNIVIRSIRIFELYSRTCFAKSLYVNRQCSTSKIEAGVLLNWEGWRADESACGCNIWIHSKPVWAFLRKKNCVETRAITKEIITQNVLMNTFHLEMLILAVKMDKLNLWESLLEKRLYLNTTREATHCVILTLFFLLSNRRLVYTHRTCRTQGRQKEPRLAEQWKTPCGVLSDGIWVRLAQWWAP